MRYIITNGDHAADGLRQAFPEAEVLPWQAQAAVFAGFGLSFYFLHGSIQIFVTELVPSARSIATAIHSTFFFLGQSVGPIYYRIAFDEAGTAPTLIFSGCVLILTGIVCSLGLTSQRPR